MENFDVVDLYEKVKKELPKVNFILVHQKLPIRYYDAFNFRIKEYYGQQYEQPIKTTITINSNYRMTEAEMNEIVLQLKTSLSIVKPTLQALVEENQN